MVGPIVDRAAPPVIDGLGREVRLAAPPSRIVSLVPSLTEALFALGLRAQIVGRTEYCVQPAALVADTPTFGGTKTPQVQAIINLQPDLVIASAEENVREHVQALLDAGLTVYISLPRTVRRALAELKDLARMLGREREAAPWLADAHDTLAALERRAAMSRPVRYFCPIWRRPYMAARTDTYMSDVLRICGGENIFSDGPAHYYPVELADAAARNPEVILLPDEPYPFSTKHVAELRAYHTMPAVRDERISLCDGQMLTWYGPRIGEGLRAVSKLLGGGA